MEEEGGGGRVEQITCVGVSRGPTSMWDRSALMKRDRGKSGGGRLRVDISGCRAVPGLPELWETAEQAGGAGGEAWPPDPASRPGLQAHHVARGRTWLRDSVGHQPWVLGWSRWAAAAHVWLEGRPRQRW